VLDDYFAQPWARSFFRILIAIILPIMWALGIYLIWTS
jgi:succinate dehydrogenase hydrophobic anchor subunit